MRRADPVAPGRRHASSGTTPSRRPIAVVADSRQAAAASSATDMYQQPALYDEVFSYRDVPAEAAFVKAVYERYSPGRKLETLLELGCGPAHHATELAKSGVRVWGLDASAPMLEYARQLAEKAGVGSGAAFVQGDMADFEPPGEGEGRLDAAVCLLGTFSHMTTNDKAVGCFRSLARCLRPGGLLLLELAHPGERRRLELGGVQGIACFDERQQPAAAAACCHSRLLPSRLQCCATTAKPLSSHPTHTRRRPV